MMIAGSVTRRAHTRQRFGFSYEMGEGVVDIHVAECMECKMNLKSVYGASRESFAAAGMET